MSARIPVSILGATGTVGQRLVTLLDGHPRFEVVSLVASSRSAGRAYSDAVHWRLSGEPPASVARIEVSAAGDPPAQGARLALSSLDPSVARDTEERFARAGVQGRQAKKTNSVSPPASGTFFSLASKLENTVWYQEEMQH